MADSDMRELMNFILDINCLSKINEYSSKINIFRILKLEEMEIRHSNILAWLLDSNETHGLGSSFATKFLSCIIRDHEDEISNFDTCKLLLKSTSDFIVKREHLHIDILLICRKTKQLICIENKVGSKEGDNQLRRYREKLESEFDDYEKMFLYLKPVDEDIHDNWIKISYEYVLEALDLILKENINIDESVKLIIDNYIDTLKRCVMVNENEIEEICLEIYKKHKTALDLIFKYKPDESEPIYETIVEVLKDQNNVIYDEKYSSGKTIRFRTVELDRILPTKTIDFDFDWKHDYPLMYHIYHYEKINQIIFQIILASSNNIERETIYKSLSNRKQKDNIPELPILKSTVFKIDKFNSLDELLEELRKWVKKCIEQHVKDFEEKLEEALKRPVTHN